MTLKAIAGCCLELSAQLAEVINLSVKDDPVAARWIAHRLVAERREIDDGEARVRKADLTISVKARFNDYRAGIVGTAMGKRAGSIFEDAARNASVLRDNPKDPTHRRGYLKASTYNECGRSRESPGS